MATAMRDILMKSKKVQLATAIQPLWVRMAVPGNRMNFYRPNIQGGPEVVYPSTKLQVTYLLIFDMKIQL